MAGLLDDFSGFIRTPEGQGLLAATFGGLAGARKGEPINSFGRAGLAGISGYGNALERDQQTAQLEQRKKFQDMQMSQAQMQMDAATRQQVQEQGMRDAAKAATISPDRANALSMGPMPNGGAVPEVKPGFNNEQYIQNLFGMGAPKEAMQWQEATKPKPLETKVVGGSLVQIGPDGATPIFTEKKEPKEIDPNKPFMMVDGKIVPNEAYQAFDLRSKSAGAPKMSVDLRDPTAVAGAAMKLQNDYRSATKPSYARAQAYDAMTEAAKNPSAKGDLTMVYSFVKALDPESVVREGEISLLNANRSVPDSIKGYAQRLATGQSLLPKEREDLLNQARTLTQTDFKRSRNDIKAYRENATRLGLDPELYTPDPYATFKPKEDAPTAVNIPTGAINMLKMKPSLKADFDAKYGAGAADKALGGR